MTVYAGCRDDIFGPSVQGCSRFDFTLLFEDTILSLLPSYCFLIAGLVRCWILSGKSTCVASCYQRWLKLGVLLVYGAIQIAILIVLALDSRFRHASSLAAIAVSTVCSILLCVLSFIEHSRSIRPSTILILYLSLTTLFDAVKVRTLWFINPGSTLTILFTISVVVKGLAFLLETIHKSKYLLPKVSDKTPEETCGVISLCLSFWLEGLLRRGLKWQLSIRDLYNLGTAMSSQTLEEAFVKQWTKQRSTPRNHHTLFWCCAHVLKWPLLGVIPLRIALLAFTVLQPILLQSLLTYLGEVNRSRNVGDGLVGAYVLVYLGMAISKNIYWYYHLRTITKLRAILVAAISRHTGAVNIHLLEDPKSPITLMSNDVERIVQGVRHFHDLWANLIQAGVALYILERQAGVACVIPVGVIVIVSVIVGRITSTIGAKQIKWMEAIEKRIAATSSLLDSMKGVKMKGLEDRFSNIITNLRSQDVKCGNGYRRTIAFIAVLAFVPEFLAPLFTFLVLVVAPQISSSPLDATKIFTTLTTLLILAAPLNNLFQTLPFAVAAFGSLERIGKFLLTDEQTDLRQFDNSSKTSSFDLDLPEKSVRATEKQRISATEDGSENLSSRSTSPVFRITDGAFRWGDKPDTISKVNLSIPRAVLTTIIGPVGCGKSTLCETLLGQTQKSSGNLFAQIDSPQIAYCSQKPHLANVSIKENIIAYSSYDQTWYSTVVRATGLVDGIASMQDCDDTIVGSNGSKLSGGQKQRVAIARAVYSRKKMVIFDDVFSGLDRTNANMIFNVLLGPNGLLRQNSTTVILVTHLSTYLASSDHIIAMSQSGSIFAEGSYNEIISLPEYEMLSALVADKFDDDETSQAAIQEDMQGEKEPESEDAMRRACQPGEWKIYSFYGKAIGAADLLILVFLSGATAAFWSYSNLWLGRWANYIGDSGSGKNGYFIGIYAVFQCLTILGLLGVGTHALMRVAAKAGKSLHTILLRSVIATPLAILTATDTGQVINKFSQDIQLIDSELPMAQMNFIACTAIGIGQGIVIIIVSPWTGLAFPPLLIILYIVQKFYLRTSKQIRILDLEAKSPLYSYFLDTVSGLSTIRAFGWTSMAQRQLHTFLDSSQKPYYFLLIIQQWLWLVLDLVIAVVAIVVVTIAVSLGSRSSSVGVALVQLVAFNGMLGAIIIMWTQIETSIAAVTRIKEHSDKTESEHEGRDDHREPPSGWPSHGKVEFKDASMVYQSHRDEVILRNIDLEIQPGEKIGLCGRSGSGKSSLAVSLFRMTELVSGSITIDGVDLDTLPAKYVRLHLNAVPQEACFVPGTIRLNLQPPENSSICSPDISDEELIDVLRKTKLWDVVEKNGGLDAEFKDSIFSHGQKQLFSLASSLLRPSKIVVLDEFTSSVDPDTDALMQQLIHERFSSSTVISIAHRLDTIMSCDRIVMLEKGSIVESGPPRELLAKGREGSAFARFVDEKKSNEHESGDTLNESEGESKSK